MKAELKKAIAAFEACHQRSVAKGDFTGVFADALLASTLNPGQVIKLGTDEAC
ncbi:hypothetical protein AAF712_014979 [Marasmius tenuissimus]|uniref:Uncharacterized protein n=1 Tax=Marasmius tenuissimus TaxID=585030 RepID=A0ABR2ZAF7_9AGAR